MQGIYFDEERLASQYRFYYFLSFAYRASLSNGRNWTQSFAFWEGKPSQICNDT